MFNSGVMSVLGVLILLLLFQNPNPNIKPIPPVNEPLTALEVPSGRSISSIKIKLIKQ